MGHKCKEVIVIRSSAMSEHAVVLCSAGSDAEAGRIAQTLVERRLAACVNVVPGVRSTYRWEGAVRTDSEWLLVVKTRRDRFEEVRSAIRELHSYELPEIVMLDLAGGDAAYLAWIDESLGRSG
jgi:periplasmic divalent cation tolerance protein